MKPPLCLPFQPPTSPVPKDIRQTPLASSLHCTRPTLDTFTLFMENRAHGTAAGDMSELCPMVARHYTAKPPQPAAAGISEISVVRQGLQSKTSGQSHNPCHTYFPPVAPWKYLGTPQGDSVPICDQRPCSPFH